MNDSTLETDARTEMILCAGLCVFGFILMFVAHFVASFGPDTRLEGGWLPYWWTYPLLYPVTAFQATQLAPRRWLPISFALCATPVLYFLALGVSESNWRASSSAWMGALITLALSMLLGYAATLERKPQNR